MAARLESRLTEVDARTFGLKAAATCVILGLLLWIRGIPAVSVTLLGVGAMALALRVLCPMGLVIAQRAWYSVTFIAAKALTCIVLALLYLLVITPVGVALRFFRESPLNHQNQGGSYWIPKTVAERQVRNMERLF